MAVWGTSPLAGMVALQHLCPFFRFLQRDFRLNPATIPELQGNIKNLFAPRVLPHPYILGGEGLSMLALGTTTSTSEPRPHLLSNSSSSPSFAFLFASPGMWKGCAMGKLRIGTCRGPGV